MDGRPGQITSRDGTRIAFETAGQGPPLLLVHGSTADRERWAPVWPQLTAARTVVAMDRRGRGDSGDGPEYALQREHEDVRLLAEQLAEQAGAPVDVFGHSYGAVCVLGAAASGAPFRRVVLYEPPAVEAVPAPVQARLDELLAAGQDDEALRYFLVDVVGRSEQDVERLRGTPTWVRRVAAVRTLSREAEALRLLELAPMAARTTVPVLLLLGGTSPPWAAAVLQPIAQALPDGRLVTLEGQGHMAIDAAPDLVVREVLAFLG